MTESRVSPPTADLTTLGRRGLVVGGLFAVVSLAGLVSNPTQFFRSYLVAFALVLGVALGSLAISMLHHMSGGAWGLVIRRILEASSRTITLVVCLFLARNGPMQEVLQSRHVHDLGKLLLAFTMLWAYFALSQFLIIWSGNLPEEIGFFHDRLTGGWGAVSLALPLFHFAVPFVFLLSRNFKRAIGKLVWIAALLLFMRWVDLYWLVAPTFHPGKLSLHWLDLTTPCLLYTSDAADEE